jgi:putative ubiquitin-RnfH superfamily antitoxin RatB of RatAB toxin-antitoxin module
MVSDNVLPKIIPIEVAYASANQSWLIPFEVEEGTTVQQAIASSGILEQCLDINLQTNKVGLFSKIIELDVLVRAGDRIEIYRPLILDPKEARRLRAEKAKQKK